MNITILFDKETKNKNLHTGWGVSFLINKNILFDTGSDGKQLIDNMKCLGVDIHAIDTAVISHDHWDHTSGLTAVLKRKKGIKVYVCPGFSGTFKNEITEFNGNVIEAKAWRKIGDSIYTTGEIIGAYKGNPMPEQSLAVKTSNGISIITGCSHPGVEVIAAHVAQRFPKEKMYCVLGGFHLKDHTSAHIRDTVNELQKLGVQTACPTHCSGDQAEAIFKEIFKTAYMPVRVGCAITV